MDLEFRLQGTAENFCVPRFQYHFGAQSVIRVDVPSMLLSAPGQLLDEGATEKFTRMSVSDSQSQRRLSAEFNRATKTSKVRFRDSNGVMGRGTLELRLDPESKEPLVLSPTSQEISTVVTAASVDSVGLTPAQIQELGRIYNGCITLHLGLNASKFQEGARAAGRRVDWAALASNRDTYGRALRSKLLLRLPPTPAEFAHRSRMIKLAKGFPILDTRQPECPPFLVRGRLRGERRDCDISLRHRGGNELELTVVSVDDGVPYLACVDRRGFGLNPGKPEIMLLEGVKMQSTLTGGDGVVRTHLQASMDAKNEQFANFDFQSLLLKGCVTLEDAGSTDDLIRLTGRTLSGNRIEAECRPNLPEPKCYVRLDSEEDVATEIELAINPRTTAPLASMPDRVAFERIAPVWTLQLDPTFAEITEVMKLVWKCMYLNRAPDDASAREAYSLIDRTTPDWDVVRVNRRRVGEQLRDLMSVARPTPTRDDTPIAPQLAAEEIR